MGLDITVRCASLPQWSALSQRFQAQGLAVAVKMIDGLPAFPDEEPPAEWQELRVALPAGMVTLRRMPEGVRLVTWENASVELLTQRDGLAAALREP